MAFVAITGANAANVINGNPLYRPAEGHFVSETYLTTGEDTYANPQWVHGYDLTERFMYGFTDDLALGVDATASYDTDNSFDSESLENKHQLSFESVYFNASYRFMDICAFKADFIGSVGREFITQDGLHTGATVWGAGVKAGLDLGDMAIAGTIFARDIDLDVNFGDAHGGAEMWTMTADIEAQLVLSDEFNLVAGAIYSFDVSDTGYYNDYMEVDNPLVGKVGVNYNLDETKYFGAYATYDMNADSQAHAWGIGVKFGIDF